MKFYVTILYLCTYILVSCSPEKRVEDSVQESFYISLKNNIAQSRKDEPIVISRKKLESLTRKFPQNHIPRLIGENGEEVPLQTDDIDGDGEWDEVSFSYSILPVYTAVLKVETVALALSSDFENRTNIVVYHQKRDKENQFAEAGNISRAQPFSALSGIAWENDKMGFMLDFYPEPVKLILGKRTDKMILNKIDFDSKSLVRQSWGRKLFNRIDSIGPGSLTFMKDSVFGKIENYDSLIYQIIAQGPVKSSFKITYKGVQSGSTKFNLEEKITVWARQDGYQNTISSAGLEDDLTLGAAIPVYRQNAVIQNNEGSRYHSVATFNIKGDNDATALGMLLPKIKMAYNNTDTVDYDLGSNLHFVKFNVNDQEPVKIHVYAGWQHQDEKFKDPEGFITILDKEANRLSNPIEIEKYVEE